MTDLPDIGAIVRMGDDPRHVQASQDVRDDLLSQNVRLIHEGRPTCDEAGRPLSTYMCQYHEGFLDGLDKAFETVEYEVATLLRMAGWKFDRG